MNWFSRLVPSRIRTQERKHTVPEGLWTKCDGCDAVLYQPELARNLQVCPKCGTHLRIRARSRLEAFLDKGSAVELAANVQPVDVLKFRDSKRYKDRLAQAQKATGEQDALIVMQGKLKGLPLVVAAFEFEFMAGSMGSVVGEKFVRAVRQCIADGQPWSASPRAAVRVCRRR